MDSVDSDVAEFTELENSETTDAGLENRLGPWPLQLSSNKEQDEIGLTLSLVAVQEVLPLTIGWPVDANIIFI